MNKINLKDVASFFYMVPALIIGTLGMASYDVSPVILVQNGLVWVLCTVVGIVILRRKKMNVRHHVFVYVSLVLCSMPFLFNGIDGFHRWITIGPISVYIASIVLPLLIIQLWRMTKNDHINKSVSVALLVALVLFFQPDAGQLTAFACASAILFWNKMKRKRLKAFYLSTLLILVSLSWVFIDKLAPVPYVEQILYLVANMGTAWLVLGGASLFLLFIPFYSYRNTSVVSASLVVYFLMTIVVTFLGNFPMPIMGYGTSPIVGYLLAVTWCIKFNR